MPSAAISSMSSWWLILTAMCALPMLGFPIIWAQEALQRGREYHFEEPVFKGLREASLSSNPLKLVVRLWFVVTTFAGLIAIVFLAVLLYTRDISLNEIAAQGFVFSVTIFVSQISSVLCGIVIHGLTHK